MSCSNYCCSLDVVRALSYRLYAIVIVIISIIIVIIILLLQVMTTA
jgi:hypothetical protein